MLVRHGQTDWNLARRWQGHLDIPLNENGRRQARLLASRLATLPIKAIYSSDLVRASETAEIVAKRLKIQPILDPALRERNGGSFQGLTFEELQEQFPVMWRRVRLEYATPPGGESLYEVAKRLTSAFEAISRRHKGEMVMLVSHGGALNLLISHIVGLPLGQPAKISLRGNTGLSIIEIGDDGGRLVTLNDIHHLKSSSDPDLALSPPSPAEAPA